MRAERPDWSGTVVCIASGPSLTAEDCEAVRGHTAVVTNSSFRLALWADILFGHDSRWWKAHLAEVKASGFQGRLLTASAIGGNLGVETTHHSGWLRTYPNSGAAAIGIAIAGGASRIVLLGFDCGFSPDGRRHWHADHPNGMTNCKSIGAWPRHFKNVAKDAEQAGIPVLNASRSTALRCFPRVELSAAL
jgi:hypothetical protein